MAVTQLSQKEYLKKYLSHPDDKKKKKKKKPTKSAQERFRVVDDDIDLKNMRPLDEDEIDLYNLAEDAPQIAGIIDERPDETRTLEEFRGSKRWKIMSDENGDNDIKIIPIGSTSKQQEDKKLTKSSDSNPSSSKKYTDNSDTSPPRKSRVQSDSDISPPRNTNDFDKDQSPPRKVRKRDESDTSPPRKNKKSGSDLSPVRRSKDSRDLSPVRRKKHDTDLSPTRKNRNKMDQSPLRKGRYEQDKSGLNVRKTKADGSSPRRNKHASDLSPPRKSRLQNDSDTSPPRRTRRSDSDQSPLRNSKKQEKSTRRHDSDSDASPPRKNARHYGSPSGKDDSRSARRKSLSPLGRNRSKSPPGRGKYQKSLPHNGPGRSESVAKSKGKMEKTLDGKRAGLQDARELKEEISSFKKREDELFAKVGDKMLGRGAAAVMRDRTTGKRRNLEEEAKQREEDEEKLAIHKEKYSRWGKGLKQVEEQKENLQQALHEMSKPLARYADDDDLERHLRDQEREGDPMLEYIRSKKTDDSTKSRPKYQGSFLPNRFGIPPGHRWDGVDRSNGYEKQWFEHQNSRKAVEEEGYKWSTSDM